MTSDKRLMFAEFKDEHAWPQLQLVYLNYRPLVLFGFEGQKLDTLVEKTLHLQSMLCRYINYKTNK